MSNDHLRHPTEMHVQRNDGRAMLHRRRGDPKIVRRHRHAIDAQVVVDDRVPLSRRPADGDGSYTRAGKKSLQITPVGIAPGATFKPSQQFAHHDSRYQDGRRRANECKDFVVPTLKAE